MTIIGVIYGVFLAFVIFSLWEQRTKAQDHLEAESSQPYVLFRLAREFSAPSGPVRAPRTRIQAKSMTPS